MWMYIIYGIVNDKFTLRVKNIKCTHFNFIKAKIKWEIFKSIC